jgi:MFS family permease
MSPWSPFRHRVFRFLWIAQLASNIGTWMQTVGAAWLMVELDASPAVVALVQTATYLPVVLVGVAAGATADLIDRRRLLMVTQLFMLVAAGVLAVLTALGTTTPWSLLALTFCLGLGAAFNAPAWQAIQPELVPREEFVQAVTLGGASINLGRAVGPAVGGALIALAGPWLVFALNAVSFAAVILVLWRWRRPVEDDPTPPERFAGALRAGLRYALFSHSLHGVLVRSFAFALASAGLIALLPVYSSRVLGLGSGGLGLLYAGFGAGAVLMAAFLPRLRGRLSADRVFALGALLVAAVLLSLFAIEVAWPAFIVCIVAGAGWLCCLSVLNVASQEVLPGWVRARGLALYLTVLAAGIAAGSYGWGRVANEVGSQSAFAWSALALVLTLLLAVRWRFAAASRLDLSPAPMASPEVRLAVEDTSSPVLIVVAYEVRPDAEDDFLRAVRVLGRARRRTGAVSWSIYEDADRPHRFLETYVVPTWEEHIRQHVRRTATDAAVQEMVRGFLREGTQPTVKHFVAPPEPSFMESLREHSPGVVEERLRTLGKHIDS